MSFVTKPRVLMVVPQPFFALRGSPMRVRCMVESVTTLGYEVDLLVLPLGQDIVIPGATIRRSWSIPGINEIPIGPSWSKLLLDFGLSIFALKEAAIHRYDVLHGIEEGGIVTAVLSRLFGIPTIFDMHSCMSVQIRDRKFLGSSTLASAVQKLEEASIRRASGVITVSPELTTYAREIAPTVPAETIYDIPLDSSARVDPDLVTELRNALPQPSATVLLYTGNFYQYQGVELLLEAFSVVCKRQSSVERQVLLLLVGEGESKSDLEIMAAKLGVSNRVVFAGQQPVEQMGNFMAMADVLVSPRITGGNTPLKIYSYMASGRPIVATNISSHTQVLDASCAFLCEPSPEGLAVGLQEAIRSDPSAAQDRDQRVVAALRRVEERYSKRVFLRKVEDLYQRILEPDTALKSSAQSASKL